MQLSTQLQEQVSSIAHRYGSGWDGDDMMQDCFAKLWELPDDTTELYALKASHNLCRDALRKEERRACQSTDDDNFFEPVLDGKVVDKEKYIEHIHNLRLKNIVDQYVDGEKPLTNADMLYLGRYRKLLDRSFEKYLKQVSQFMLFYWKVAPFHVALN